MSRAGHVFAMSSLASESFKTQATQALGGEEPSFPLLQRSMCAQLEKVFCLESKPLGGRHGQRGHLLQCPNEVININRM